jgi:hypothetical protein
MSSNDFYLNNPLLKRTNVPMNISSEQAVEFAKCMEDPIYFAQNYVKIVTLDHGLQPYEPYHFQEKMIRTFHENRFSICKLPRQPLAIDTPIPTPNGFVNLGDLKIGDYVYTPKLNTTKVINKTEVFNDTECYAITFSTKETIVADSYHLWQIFDKNKKEIEIKTEDLFKSEYKQYTLKRKSYPGMDVGWNIPIQILDINKVDGVPTQCITVDSDEHLFLCGRTHIPTKNSGKSTTVVAFLLHYMIFYDNVNIAILANKAKGAMEALARFQTAYENIPIWLQQGVKSWNKGSLELENGSKILAASTSASSVRGGSYNIIYLDEFAFVPQQVADSFFTSVLPTISAGVTTKIIITSTPLGLNHFYKLWRQAIEKENDYVPIDIHWTDVPGRDEDFKRKMIAAFGGDLKKWQQEFETEFLGSANTLISGTKLTTLVTKKPITANKGLDVYEDPIEGHLYMMTVDVSRGTGLDYHAFSVIDVTEFPHKLVAKYRNNELDPILYPYVIKDTAMAYNKAYVLCETNDLGSQVANSIHHDLEYPNLLVCLQNGRRGQLLGQNFPNNKIEMGVKMSPKVKHIGCINLKTLIESDKLIINDIDVISELTTFIQKGKSFEADSGRNDDLVMTLVIFAWAANQQYFKNITDQDIRKKLYEEKEKELEQDLLPFGFINLGDNDLGTIKDRDGDIWFSENPLEVTTYDWYGGLY